MARALTIYECPDCALVADAEVVQNESCYLAGHDEPVPVRVFRGEDVRPLWEAVKAMASAEQWGAIVDLLSVTATVRDAFPAPPEWTPDAGASSTTQPQEGDGV